MYQRHKRVVLNRKKGIKRQLKKSFLRGKKGEKEMFSCFGFLSYHFGDSPRKKKVQRRKKKTTRKA